MKRSESLKQIAQQLRERRDELLNNANVGMDELRNQFGDQSWEDGCEEKDLENDELISALTEHSFRELQQIQHALRQLRVGRYGRCEECGRNIPIARLEVIPFATTCVHCQARRESEHVSSSVGMRRYRRWPAGPMQSELRRGRRRPIARRL